MLAKLPHAILQSIGKLLGKNKLSILIYHQVIAQADPMRPNEPTAEVFDWQMQLISRYFTPLSLDDALMHLKQDSLPANAICVTFDDGYLNNLTIAQPILAKYQIPATVYVATAFSDGTNMWNDRIIHLFADTSRTQLQLDNEQLPLGDITQRRALAQQWLKKLKYLQPDERLNKIMQFYQQNDASEQSPLMMTPEQVKQLSDSGVTIGAHTVNHPILKVLPATQQLAEIEQSKQQLESWIGKTVKHFSYPNGVDGVDFNENTISLVKTLNFNSAVSTTWGISTKHTNVLNLKRFRPWDKTPIKFHARLIHNAVRR